jgi:hypothetical protein
MENTVTMVHFFRGLTLLVACGGGIFCIFLGWKLYRDGINSPVSSELSQGNKFRFTMKALGPGVFFALFGMYVIVKIVGTQAETEPVISEEIMPQTKGSQLSTFIGEAQAAPQREIARMCFIYYRIKQFDGKTISDQDLRSALSESISLLKRGRFDSIDSDKVNNAIRTLSLIKPEK